MPYKMLITKSIFMKGEIKYQDWPEKVKLVTALSNKHFFLTNHKVPLSLGYILLVTGILSLIYGLFNSSTTEGFNLLIHPLCSILIGVANIVSGTSLKWISVNSSWDERFANTSSLHHKIGYLLISAILIVCLIAFFKL